MIDGRHSVSIGTIEDSVQHRVEDLLRGLTVDGRTNGERLGRDATGTSLVLDEFLGRVDDSTDLPFIAAERDGEIRAAGLCRDGFQYFHYFRRRHPAMLIALNGLVRLPDRMGQFSLAHTSGFAN